MLIFREVNDYKLTSNFLNNYNIIQDNHNNSIIFGGFEDEDLFGLCIIHVDGKSGKLVNLIIKDEYRGDNLGDGLLRSTLNKLDKMGINYVSYPNTDSYLIKLGFTESDNNHIFVRLPDFFNNSCGNCRR